MANLDIEHIGGDNYSFKASGCHLKYFVIWKGGEEPTVNNWIDLPNVSNYNYIMDFSIENNKGIHFHVYDGNTNRRDDDEDYYNNLYQQRQIREQIEFEREQRQREMEQMKMQMKEMELSYQNKMEQIKAENEREKMRIEKEKRRLEEDRSRREEQERRKKEEHLMKVNNANNELHNLDNNLLKNYIIKISQKGINKLYEHNQLLNANNMIPKNDISQFISNKLHNASETIINSMLIESKHFNIILLGKTGVGKSTLINGILKLEQNNKAKEGYGRSTTQTFQEYTSIKRPGLRLIDSRGIEIGSHNITEVIGSVEKHIETIAKLGDPDKFIHCIWYCIDDNSARCEKEEENAIMELKDIYEEKKLPVIFALTRSFNINKYEKMIRYLNSLGINDIVPVLAKTYEINTNKENIQVKP